MYHKMCIQKIFHLKVFLELWFVIIIIIIIIIIIFIFFLKTARISVQGKDDVLILRVNVWLVGLVTTVSWVRAC